MPLNIPEALIKMAEHKDIGNHQEIRDALTRYLDAESEDDSVPSVSPA